MIYLYSYKGYEGSWNINFIHIAKLYFTLTFSNNRSLYWYTLTPL